MWVRIKPCSLGSVDHYENLIWSKTLNCDNFSFRFLTLIVSDIYRSQNLRLLIIFWTFSLFEYISYSLGLVDSFENLMSRNFEKCASFNLCFTIYIQKKNFCRWLARKDNFYAYYNIICWFSLNLVFFFNI